MCPDDSQKQPLTNLDLLSFFDVGAAKEMAGVGDAPGQSVTIALERFQLENEGIKQRLGRLESLQRLRKLYVALLFGLTVLWLLIVVSFVGFAGFHYRGFTLSDSVIIGFITSTTVSVIGLFHFAAKWLFPTTKSDDK